MGHARVDTLQVQPVGSLACFAAVFRRTLDGLRVGVQDAQLVQVIHAHGHIQQPQQEVLLQTQVESQCRPSAKRGLL